MKEKATCNGRERPRRLHEPWFARETSLRMIKRRVSMITEQMAKTRSLKRSLRMSGQMYVDLWVLSRETVQKPESMSKKDGITYRKVFCKKTDRTRCIRGCS